MPSQGSSPPIPRDVRDLLRAFCAHDVRYLVAGAHAVAYWGQPRATGSLVLQVDPGAENARHVLAALEDFAAPLAGLTLDDLARPGVVFQMGSPPYRIDLATVLPGVTFEAAWNGRATLALEDLAIPVIAREALVRSLRATGRPEDRFDLGLLGEG